MHALNILNCIKNNSHFDQLMDKITLHGQQRKLQKVFNFHNLL